MTITDGTEITLLLQRWRAGDQDCEERIFELLLPQLRTIAARLLRNEPPGHSLQPTALVNEAFLRLVTAKDIDWKDRGHFLALTARIMRRYLVDHARARFKGKLVSLDGFPADLLGNHSKLDLIVAVDRVLDELEKQAPRQRVVIEMKFFLKLTDLETTQALKLTLRTFQREWHVARTWLFKKLDENNEIRR
jgi:RNA polymerase sigma factor (TIGR02999 family)